MALTIVGTAPEVLDPVGDPLTITFTPTVSWARDDILCGVIMLGTTAGAVSAPTDDTGENLSWHRVTTLGVGKFAHDGVHTYFALHARIPQALHGSTDPIVVTVDVTSALTYGIVLPGLAVRGAKRLATRHTAASTISTDPDHSSALSVGTLPAHSRASSGDAGAIEYAVGNNTSTGYTTDTLVMTFAGGTLIDAGSLHQNFDGTRDILLAEGYRIHGANLPSTETAASLVFNGVAGGYILRFLWEFDLNQAPVVSIADAVDSGDLLATVTASAYDPEEAAEAAGVYPELTSLHIDWGDGDDEDVALTDGNNHDYTHTYAGGGTYTVTMTATDEDGAEGEDTMDVLLVGAPATATPPPYELTSRRVDIRELPHEVTSRMFDDL